MRLAIGLDTQIGRFSVSMLLPLGRYERKHDFCVESLMEFRSKLLNEIGVTAKD